MLTSNAGLQSYHAVDEIFKSNHNQTDISSKTVIWTCAVLPLSKWIGFAASDANPAVPSKPLRGPVTCENFNMHKDLAACKSICERAAKRRKEGVDAHACSGFLCLLRDSSIVYGSVLHTTLQITISCTYPHPERVCRYWGEQRKREGWHRQRRQ